MKSFSIFGRSMIRNKFDHLFLIDDFFSFDFRFSVKKNANNSDHSKNSDHSQLVMKLKPFSQWNNHQKIALCYTGIFAAGIWLFILARKDLEAKRHESMMRRKKIQQLGTEERK